MSSSKNPFARTAGMTRDRSMHKSTSFFDRVDASMDSNAKDSTSQKSKGNKVKQSTLFSSMAKTKPAPAATPAFASQQGDNDDEDDITPSSLQLTLQAAARKDEASLRLEETQFEAEESQFDSLPIDVSV